MVLTRLSSDTRRALFMITSLVFQVGPRDRIIAAHMNSLNLTI